MATARMAPGRSRLAGCLLFAIVAAVFRSYAPSFLLAAKAETKKLVEPKRPGSGYNIYTSERLGGGRWKENFPGLKYKEAFSMVAQEWSNEVSEEEKERYKAEATQKFEQYKKDCAEFVKQGGVLTVQQKKKAALPKLTKQGKVIDPDKPKMPARPYILYTKDTFAEVRDELGGTNSMPEVAKEVGKRWEVLPESEKARYQEQHDREMEKYKKVMEEYKGPTMDSRWKMSKKGNLIVKNIEGKPKRPLTGFFRFAADVRPAIQEALDTRKGSEVMKEAGRQWKSLPEALKQEYNQAYQDELPAYMEALANFKVPGFADNVRMGSTGLLKVVKDPDQPKRPMSSFFLFLKEVRQEIAYELFQGGKEKVGEVTKEAGARWRAMSDAEKQKYVALYQENKKKYDAEMEDYKKAKAAQAEAEREAERKAKAEKKSEAERKAKAEKTSEAKEEAAEAEPTKKTAAQEGTKAPTRKRTTKTRVVRRVPKAAEAEPTKKTAAQEGTKAPKKTIRRVVRRVPKA